MDALVPIKRKLLRANHIPYMTKPFRKAIIKTSELENECAKDKTNANFRSYKKTEEFLH